MPNPQAGGLPFIGCPRLLIQCISSYPPYLEAVSSIRNLRSRHAVVTRDPPNIGRRVYAMKILSRGGNQDRTQNLSHN
jgi:hypothetical protein